jgi:hypothetical protein
LLVLVVTKSPVPGANGGDNAKIGCSDDAPAHVIAQGVNIGEVTGTWAVKGRFKIAVMI